MINNINKKLLTFMLMLMCIVGVSGQTLSVSMNKKEVLALNSAEEYGIEVVASRIVTPFKVTVSVYYDEANMYINSGCGAGTNFLGNILIYESFANYSSEGKLINTSNYSNSYKKTFSSIFEKSRVTCTPNRGTASVPFIKENFTTGYLLSPGSKKLAPNLHLTVRAVLKIEGDLPHTDIIRIKIPGVGVLRGVDFISKSYTLVSVYLPDGRNLRDSRVYYYGNNYTEKDALDARMGDVIKFKNVTTPRPDGTTILPIIKGVPSTWIAKFGEEALYYCSPNTTPGEFKPWLGFDTWVHTLWVRSYEEEYGKLWNPREKPWILNGPGEYRWEWIAQHRMDSFKTSYTPSFTWNKTKLLPFLIQYPDGGFTHEQRNSQKEGTLMDIFHSWPNWNAASGNFQNYTGPKYAHGFDEDEIVYFGGKNQDTRTSPPTKGLFKFVGTDPWKLVPRPNVEGTEGVPINDVVTAYRKNREFFLNKNNNYSTKYDGYEIQDVGTKKDTPNGSGTGVNTAPGWITIRSETQSLRIPINVKAPLTFDKGFYNTIVGTQWPSVDEKNVPYSVTSIPDLERDKFVLEYVFSDGFKKFTTTRYSSNPEDGNFDDAGNWNTNFSMGGWGYNYITLYYEPIKGGERTMIAGKELFYIELMYLSNWGDPLNEKRADRNHVILNEFRTSQYGAPYINPGPWGNLLKKQFYRYVFNQDDLDLKNFKLTVYDVDPHSFLLPDGETDWYQPERKSAKSIPNTAPNGGESLQTNLKYYVSKCPTKDCDNVPKGDFKGSGQDWTHDWSTYGPGTYQLAVEYRGESRLYIIVDIVNYTDDRKGDITSRALTAKERSWLKITNDPDGSKYRILEVDRVLTKYILNNGPRVQNNIPFVPTAKTNRFGENNDFGYNFRWSYFVTSLSPLIPIPDIPEVTSFVASYNNNNWFPNDWVRHYFVNAYKDNNNTGLPPDINPALIKHSINDFSVYLDGILGKEKTSGIPHKQINFPWVISSIMDGKRVRMPPKPIFNLAAIFDNNTGAFSGTPKCDRIGCDFYYMGDISNGALASPPNDDDKDKDELFRKLSTGTAKIYDDSLGLYKTIQVTNEYNPNLTGPQKFIHTVYNIPTPYTEKYAINTLVKHQTIDAFGASDAWSMHHLSFKESYSPADYPGYVGKLLFSQGVNSNGNPEGIGLSGWRFNLGAGSAEQGTASKIPDPFRRVECFMNADGSYNWGKQGNAVAWLRIANNYGVKDLTIFANSPPVFLTSNQLAHGDNNIAEGSTLNQFAKFLVDVAKQFKTAYNIDIDYISPVNEPQYSWANKTPAQEGNSMSNIKIGILYDIIANQLATASLPNTKVALGEATDYGVLIESYKKGWNYKSSIIDNSSSNQIDELFKPLNSRGSALARNIDFHSYWSYTLPAIKDEKPENLNLAIEMRKQFKDKLDQFNSTLTPDIKWKASQTEFTFYGDNGSPFVNSMERALQVARTIHLDLTLANVSSWYWWTAVSTYDYNDGLISAINNQPSGSTTILNPTKILYALGQFSRFVRPGMERIEISSLNGITPLQAATASENGLMLSAYRDPKDSNMVVVGINLSKNRKKISISSPQGAQSWNMYITNASNNMTFQGSFNINSDYYIPSESIVTFSTKKAVTPTATTVTQKSIADQKTSAEKIDEVSVVMSPNPVKDDFVQVKFDAISDGNVDFQVFNLNGKLVFNINKTVTKGSQDISLMLGLLADGTYIVKGSGAGISFTQKLIVKH